MRFSERLKLREPQEAEIKIRNEAPYGLRGVIIDLAYEGGLLPSELRDILCRVLRKRKDPNNWSEKPNIENENQELLDSCGWYEVYDIIEEICKNLKASNRSPKSISDAISNALFQQYQTGERVENPEIIFSDEVNRYFRREGIGWKLCDGKIEVRGPDLVESVIQSSIAELGKADKNTTKKELKEAFDDLSRRPDPDITGAIQHSFAAVECLAREVTGRDKSTLGDIVKKHPDIFPKPLNTSVEKAWGYASQFGRHIKEAKEPDFEDGKNLSSGNFSFPNFTMPLFGTPLMYNIRM